MPPPEKSTASSFNACFNDCNTNSALPHCTAARAHERGAEFRKEAERGFKEGKWHDEAVAAWSWLDALGPEMTNAQKRAKWIQDFAESINLVADKKARWGRWQQQGWTRWHWNWGSVQCHLDCWTIVPNALLPLQHPFVTTEWFKEAQGPGLSRAGAAAREGATVNAGARRTLISVNLTTGDGEGARGLKG